MHIEMTTEMLLTQFGYQINEQTLEQINNAIANTIGFEKFSKHLLSLKDEISHFDGFIALSNSHAYFKVKCEESSSQQNIDEFIEVVMNWSHKYKVELKQVEKKPTYYIIGTY